MSLGPKIEFELKETVRVKEGPFADFIGSVEEILLDKRKSRYTSTCLAEKPRSSWIILRWKKSNSPAFPVGRVNE